MTSTTAPTVTLLHGAEMPRLGLGTSPMDDGVAEKVVAAAIGLGYRLVDTAENYDNERGVGRGLKAAGVARDELFVTTKFNKRWHASAASSTPCHRLLNLVVTNNSSRGTPDALSPRPTPRSLP